MRRSTSTGAYLDLALSALCRLHPGGGQVTADAIVARPAIFCMAKHLVSLATRLFFRDSFPLPMSTDTSGIKGLELFPCEISQGRAAAAGAAGAAPAGVGGPGRVAGGGTQRPAAPVPMRRQRRSRLWR